MTSSALFGNTSGLGGSTGNSKHLVEFRAGRMTLKGRMVYPDKRKGFLYVYQSDDSLMHFCWKDRVNGAVEDDLIIFPDDCEFLRVQQCATGRVYVLKFKSSSRKLFFWMQEPKTDKDEEFCRRINEVLNNPPTVGGGRGGSSGNQPDGDLQNLLNSMSQQQLMQLFGNVGQMSGLSSLLGTISRPSTGQSSRGSVGAGAAASTRATSRPPRSEPPTTAPPPPPNASATTTPTPATQTERQSQSKSGRAIHLSDLQRYLSRLSAPETSAEGTENSEASAGGAGALAGALLAPAAAVAATPHAIRLSRLLAPVEGEAGHKADPEPKVEDDAPQGARPVAEEELNSTLLSPQFAQAAKLFTSALASGQLGPVILQFGLETDVVNAANKGDIEEFIKALEKSESKDDAEGDESKPKKDEEEQMALD